MKQKLLYGLAFCVFLAIVVYVYRLHILPPLIHAPFTREFAQDYIGARALLNQSDELYPILGPAFSKIGIQWNVSHASTHPPTAFLLAVPLAFLSYPAAQILWMAAMFACLVVTAHVFTLSWKKSVLVGVLSLAWPPTIWSLYQFTPIWLLGVALAYRFRDRPVISGILIGFASLPKFLAAITMLHYLKRWKGSAWVGFILTWVGALAGLFLLRPDFLASYIASNASNSFSQILREDNSALLIAAWRWGGWLGLGAAVILILRVLYSALQNDNLFGWGCIVWLGIALLPIAWVYSLLPLLPWLVLALRVPMIRTRILAYGSLLLPYASFYPGKSSYMITLSMILSGIALALVSEVDKRQFGTEKSLGTS